MKDGCLETMTACKYLTYPTSSFITEAGHFGKNARVHENKTHALIFAPISNLL